MQVQINLNDDQVDEVLLHGLKDGFRINLEFKEEPNFYEINQAFRTLLEYYMGTKAFDAFIKHYNKKKYNTKRLVEANNGL
jgi:tRNA U38,U39,U40 pseudouridine synthase TruA